MLGVELFWRHGEDEAVVLAFESGGVVAAVGIDHALGEGAGVDEFGERRGVVVVLLVELALGAENDAHVGEGGEFGVRAGGVAGEFLLVGGGGSLCRGRESCANRVEAMSARLAITAKRVNFLLMLNSPLGRESLARRELSRQSPLQNGYLPFFFMLLP